MEQKENIRFAKTSAMSSIDFNLLDGYKDLTIWQEVKKQSKLETLNAVYYIQKKEGKSATYEISKRGQADLSISLVFNSPEEASRVLSQEDSAYSLQLRLINFFDNYETYNDLKSYATSTISKKYTTPEVREQKTTQFNQSVAVLLKEFIISAKKEEVEPYIEINKLTAHNLLSESGLSYGGNFANFNLYQFLRKNLGFKFWSRDLLKEENVFSVNYTKHYDFEDKKSYCVENLKNSYSAGTLLEWLLQETRVYFYELSSRPGDNKSEYGAQNVALLKNALSSFLNDGLLEKKEKFDFSLFLTNELVDHFVEFQKLAYETSKKFEPLSKKLGLPQDDYTELYNINNNLIRVIHTLCVLKDDKQTWEIWEKALAECEKKKYKVVNPELKNLSQKFLHLVGVANPEVNFKEDNIFKKLKQLAQDRKAQTLTGPEVAAQKKEELTGKELALPITEKIIDGINTTALRKEVSSYEEAVQKSINNFSKQTPQTFQELSWASKHLLRQSVELLDFCVANNHMNQEVRLYLSAHLQSFIQNYQSTNAFIQKNAQFLSSWPELQEQLRDLETNLKTQLPLNEKRLEDLKKEVVQALSQPILKEGKVNSLFLEQKINQRRQGSLNTVENIDPSLTETRYLKSSQ